MYEYKNRESQGLYHKVTRNWAHRCASLTYLFTLLALNLVENLLWLTKAFFSSENGESLFRSTPCMYDCACSTVAFPGLVPWGIPKDKILRVHLRILFLQFKNFCTIM